MKSKILVILGALVIVSALVFGLKSERNNPLPPVDSVDEVSPPTGGMVGTKATAIKQSAWTTFQNYLSFAKTHDLAGVKSLSYQTSDTCLDPKKIKECEGLMDSAYEYGKDLQEENFTHVWYDAKQIILSTNFQRQDFGTTTVGYNRSIIYFTRDTAGNPKLLSFNPDDGVIISRQDLDDAEIDRRIKSMTRDSDEDGVVDDIENCVGYAVEKDCPTKSNPTKKDTDGDGWWDGVEIFFKK